MWRELKFQNETIRQGIRKSLAKGIVRINPDTGLIDIAPNAYAVAYDANWLFFGYNTASRDCFTWHTIMFNCFDNFVHEFCKLRCYKVVVKTRNFLDVMHFRAAVLGAPQHYGDLMPIQGKCGKDERTYTDSPYNAFIYCDGLEDALKKYQFIRRLVNEQVPDGENINIIVKRTCTEFEREHGPTDGPFWQSMTEDELHFQHLLEDIYVNVKHSSIQPDWMQNKLIFDLAEWANMIGDRSWIHYFEGNEDFMTMKAVTYHQLLIGEAEDKTETEEGQGIETIELSEE